jgi:hypothetical protein
VIAALLDPVAAAGSIDTLQRGFEESREAMIRRYISFEVHINTYPSLSQLSTLFTC